MKNLIHFGTDGWRAIIAEEFTFDNVRIVARAFAAYLKDQKRAEKGIVISYDTRFLSARFARVAAEVISSNQIPVILSESVTPTPVLSYTVQNRGLAGGIMITASHNPCEYSGIKFKDAYGGPALPAMTKAVESFLGQDRPFLDDRMISRYLHEENLFQPYLQALRSFVNFDRIKSLQGTIVVDSMYGAGYGLLRKILSDTSLQVTAIHDTADPTFGNRSPEPILKNLPELSQRIVDDKALAGFATDGDADRFGVLDGNGAFVELHDLMPLLLRHLKKTRGWQGKVVRTTSMADTVDRMAAEMGITVEEVPVGFKNVTEKMLAGDVLIGGEESGGFGYLNFIPERDGLLSILLTLEMMAVEKKNLQTLVAELRQTYGPFYYDRIDRHFDLAILQKNLQALIDQPPKKIENYTVRSVNRIDGIKIYFEENAWMLMRVSQTEPLARIYVGGESKEIVSIILNAGERLLTRIN